MKKKLFFLVAIALITQACSNNNRANNQSETNEQSWVSDAKIIADVIETAEKNLEKEVFIKGMVEHVCKHSGKRAFILDTINDISIRVESGGSISGFNNELAGMTIAVKGVLKEKQISKEYIDNWESKVKAKIEEEEEDHDHDHDHDDEGHSHSCSSEMNSINKMRKWMKENQKDYYSVYFIMGQEYEVL